MFSTRIAIAKRGGAHSERDAKAIPGGRNEFSHVRVATKIAIMRCAFACKRINEGRQEVIRCDLCNVFKANSNSERGAHSERDAKAIPEGRNESSHVRGATKIAIMRCADACKRINEVRQEAIRCDLWQCFQGESQ